MNRERLTKRLLAVFHGELEEQLRTIEADLLALEADPNDSSSLAALFRAAHTLKGAARAAGVPLVETVCHALETLLARVRDEGLQLGPDDYRLLFSSLDALREASERLKLGRELAGSRLAALARVLEAPRPPSGRSGLPPAPQKERPPAASEERPPAPPKPDTEVPMEPAPAAAAGPAPPRSVLGSQIRVAPEKLSMLLASAEQLHGAAERVHSRPGGVQELSALSRRLAAGWRSLRRRFRSELDREGVPALSRQTFDRFEYNLHRLVARAQELTFEIEEDARFLARAADEIGFHTLQLRLRPFADVCEPLPRAVRDIASATGKSARLEIEGGALEVDRAVLEKLRDALLHLVRNAVDHGIETPALRERVGKPAEGVVRVSASFRGDRLLVTVADDGGGLDVSALRERLRQRGAAPPTGDRELVDLLFQAGISTREAADEISGRGVGLDAVRATMEALHGTVTARWIGGQGTTFTLECPLTLATSRVVLIRVSSQTFAVPCGDIEQLIRIHPEEIRLSEGREVIPGPDLPVPVVGLAQLLGPPLVQQPLNGPVPAVQIAAGGVRLALLVDELVREQEVLIRRVPRIRRPPSYLSGAALLGNGTVATVLDVPALIATAAGLAERLSVTERSLPKPQQRILLVDDSISTRTLERGILEAAGYEVLTAVDGAEGWRILQEQEPDLLVSDVEMPRMDGFALCEAVRSSRRFRALPIVLVSALESPEHRARGLEVGANAYIRKSTFDQDDLLETVRQLIG